jgi:type IV secretory pathway ATPase VirB11/archaellum biosynthesis ATPase
MLEPIPFAGMVEIDESFDRTASHMAGKYVSYNEPVAYAMFRDGEYYDAIHPDEQAKTVGEYNIPLYTHPVKELTDEEIEEFSYAFQLWQLHNPYKALEGIMDFARAILRKAQE